MKKWIEAMRLRTLPVSISGVLAGIACALLNNSFSWTPALLCLLFALLAQLASNFGNEYYDYKKGVDQKGREGFRRGVTEGDISPQAMKYATFGTLGAAAIVGCLLLVYGSWWMIPVGIAIGFFALAYSAGPYPLSHHGLGDATVFVFFGLIPVTLTCFLQQGSWAGLSTALPVSASIGLLASNVLIVNNYRDHNDDKAVGKNTTVVLFGRQAMGRIYLLDGILAMLLVTPILLQLSIATLCIPFLYTVLHINTWKKLTSRQGATLNPILGNTARNLFVFTLLFLATAILSYLLQLS